ncbi:hypothetical protein ACFV42_23485 [Streptomyces solisilvae]|uniref:hypothetical protein n=1 Tax=Streptomyces malaysiensis TaxID=92644 RepID=UPI0036B54199
MKTARILFTAALAVTALPIVAGAANAATVLPGPSADAPGNTVSDLTSGGLVGKTARAAGDLTSAPSSVGLPAGVLSGNTPLTH